MLVRDILLQAENHALHADGQTLLAVRILADRLAGRAWSLECHYGQFQAVLWTDSRRTHEEWVSAFCPHPDRAVGALLAYAYRLPDGQMDATALVRAARLEEAARVLRGLGLSEDDTTPTAGGRA